MFAIAAMGKTPTGAQACCRDLSWPQEASMMVSRDFPLDNGHVISCARRARREHRGSIFSLFYFGLLAPPRRLPRSNHPDAMVGYWTTNTAT
jgi:hypothetical protein